MTPTAKMRSLLFYGPKNLKVEERDVPQISDGEMLVKVMYAGVCGTDNRIYQGTKKIPAPRIIGHEFAGEIVALDTDIEMFRPGDRVTVYPMIPCGDCYVCRSGRKNICVNRTTIGYEIDGGFSQYARVPSAAIQAGNVLTIPDGLSYAAAAASEPIAAAYHGIKRSGIEAGDAVAIVGAGPIGLFHTQLARLQRPSRLVVIEPKEEKRDLARQMGATHTIDPLTEDALERLLQLTSGEGVDVVIIDVGVPEVIEGSLGYVKKGGTFLIFAGCPHGSTITIDPNWIHYREINLTGSSASTPEIHQEVLELLAARQIDVTPLISEIVPLEDWRRAFEMKNSFTGLKTLIDPWR
jgi:L-iditol 2-dehydrogenase